MTAPKIALLPLAALLLLGAEPRLGRGERVVDQPAVERAADHPLADGSPERRGHPRPAVPPLARLARLLEEQRRRGLPPHRDLPAGRGPRHPRDPLADAAPLRAAGRPGGVRLRGGGGLPGAGGDQAGRRLRLRPTSDAAARTPASDVLHITADLDYLVCQVDCVPFRYTLTLDQPLGDTPVADPATVTILQSWVERLPRIVARGAGRAHRRGARRQPPGAAGPRDPRPRRHGGRGQDRPLPGEPRDLRRRPAADASRSRTAWSSTSR